MGFKTLTKQHKYILIASGIGIISLFLPFISLGGIISVSAINYGGLAYLVLLGFMLSGITCLINNQTQPLDDLPLFLVVAGGAAAASILIFHFFRFLSMLSFIGVGFYLAIGSSLAIIYFSLGYKEKNTVIEADKYNGEGSSELLNNSNSQIGTNPSHD